jgi:hypothetical protein
LPREDNSSTNAAGIYTYTSLARRLPYSIPKIVIVFQNHTVYLAIETFRMLAAANRRGDRVKWAAFLAFDAGDRS